MADETDVFAEAELRLKQLLEQLAAAPVMVVAGVVGAGGITGGKSRGDELWTAIFTLEVWRSEDAELQTRALNVRKEVTDEELNTLRTLITPYNIVRIEARVGIDPLSGSHQALLEAFIGSDESDTELNDCAKQLQEPVTYNDPILGIFTLDRRLDWFTANSVWKDNLVSLRLSSTEPVEVQG